MRIVLDTNVFVSAVFFGGVPGRILDAWRHDKVQLVLSAEVLDEYQRVGRILAEHYPGVDLEPFSPCSPSRPRSSRLPRSLRRSPPIPTTTSSSHARPRAESTSSSPATATYWFTTDGTAFGSCARVSSRIDSSRATSLGPRPFGRRHALPTRSTLFEVRDVTLGRAPATDPGGIGVSNGDLDGDCEALAIGPVEERREAFPAGSRRRPRRRRPRARCSR